MKTERCSVCGQGSWCNWCNGCLSFLLCCHSLMTRPSSRGSLWQNTGTRSAGRRLSDCCFHWCRPPSCETSYSPNPFLFAFLPCLFVCLTFVCTSCLSSSPQLLLLALLLCQRILYSVKSPFLAEGPVFYKWRLKREQGWGNQLVACYFHVAYQVFFCLHLFLTKFNQWFLFKIISSSVFSNPQNNNFLNGTYIIRNVQLFCYILKTKPHKNMCMLDLSDVTEWWPYVPPFWERGHEVIIL